MLDAVARCWRASNEPDRPLRELAPEVRDGILELWRARGDPKPTPAICRSLARELIRGAYLETHAEFFRQSNGQRPPAPNLDGAELDRLIDKALKRHGLEVCVDACRGIFATPHNAGDNEARKHYLGFRIALRINSSVDNPARFAANWREWAARPPPEPTEPPPPELPEVESPQWETVRAALEQQLDEYDFETWISPLWATARRPDEPPTVLRIGCPTEHHELVLTSTGELRDAIRKATHPLGIQLELQVGTRPTGF